MLARLVDDCGALLVRPCDRFGRRLVSRIRNAMKIHRKTYITKTQGNSYNQNLYTFIDINSVLLEKLPNSPEDIR